MSEEFKVGDVVVCINNTSRSGFEKCILKKGAFYKIVSLHLNSESAPCAYVGSEFVIHPLWRFKKLPPATDEFTARIRACRPNKSRQPA